MSGRPLITALERQGGQNLAGAGAKAHTVALTFTETMEDDLVRGVFIRIRP